eukprot:766411-Hanusia_phi.AAC.6
MSCQSKPGPAGRRLHEPPGRRGLVWCQPEADSFRVERLAWREALVRSGGWNNEWERVRVRSGGGKIAYKQGRLAAEANKVWMREVGSIIIAERSW